jgi:cell division protein FtsL
MVFLAAGIIVSALAVVYMRQLSREAFVELQVLSAEHDALNIEWGKLLLEQGAFSSHPRIENDAREKLDMGMPDPEQLVVVRMPGETGP